MSTLLDEGTVVLEGLDFAEECDCHTNGIHCGAEATHSLRCTACSKIVGLACIDHAIHVRTSDRTVTHLTCGTDGALRDLLEVVAL